MRRCGIVCAGITSEVEDSKWVSPRLKYLVGWKVGRLEERLWELQKCEGYCILTTGEGDSCNGIEDRRVAASPSPNNFYCWLLAPSID